MAEQEIKVVIRAEDKASAELKKLNASLASVGSSFSFELGLIKKAAVAATAGIVALGAGTVAFGLSSIKSFKSSQEGVQKLTTTMMNLKGATMADVEALKAQASQLEKVGVAADDVVIAAQAQLATFDLTGKSIAKITPGLIDMIVSEKGIAATSEDAKNAAQGLGKAFQGNFELLTKQGFVITDAQKKMIEFGTESQKADTIMQVLGTTYKNINTDMRNNTMEGAIQGMANAFDNVKKSVGEAFFNALKPTFDGITSFVQSEQFSQYVDNIKKKIDDWVASIGGPEGIKVKLTELYNKIVNDIVPAIISFMQTLGTIASFIWEHRNAIMAVAIAYEALKIGLAITGIIQAVIGAMAAATVTAGTLALAIGALLLAIGTVVLIYKGIKAYQELRDVQKELAGIVDDNSKKLDDFQSKVGTLSTQKMNDQLQASIDRARELNKEADRLSKLGFFGSVKEGLKGMWKDLTGRAVGGSVMVGQSYLVGERGPELFTPSGNGNISNTPNTGGSREVTVNFNNVQVRNDQDLNTIIDAVKRTLNREQELTRIGAFG